VTIEVGKKVPAFTAEDFAAAHAGFRKAGAVVYGVSRDTLKSHAGFKQKMAFPFELISDPDEALCDSFGVMKLKNMYGKQVRHVDEVLAFVQTLS